MKFCKLLHCRRVLDLDEMTFEIVAKLLRGGKDLFDILSIYRVSHRVFLINLNGP